MKKKSTLLQSLRALEKYAEGDDSDVIVKHVRLNHSQKNFLQNVKKSQQGEYHDNP